jgi:hypothetical protein
MSRSDEDLTTAAGHVEYELKALVGCYERLLTAEKEPPDLFAANSYLEAMLVHARCLIEFIAKSRSKRDIHRHDYVPGWELSDEVDRDEARLLFKKISKYLSHLSWRRADAAADEFPSWSFQLPSFVARLFEEFLVELESAHGEKPWFTLLKEGIHSARRRLSATPRVVGEVTTSGAYVHVTQVDLLDLSKDEPT